MEKETFSIKEAANYIGVSLSTLYRWEKCGKIFPNFRTIGNHRRYIKSHLEEKFNLNNKNTETKKVIGYARVSTHSQKEDLLNQQKVLNNIAKTNNYNDFTLISDLGSGLNYKKKD